MRGIEGDVLILFKLMMTYDPGYDENLHPSKGSGCHTKQL